MEGIDKDKILEFIKAGLEEDVKEGDHTSLATIDSNKVDHGRLLVKDRGVIAGVELAEMVFKYLDPRCEFNTMIKDGMAIERGDVAFEMSCNTQALLKGERLALNAMQRMSGIATMSKKFAEQVEDLPVTILDTRKTTPLLRFLEKWAVRIGGSSNYRDGLYDWIMIKDNHVDASGGIPNALQKTAAYLSQNNLDLGITLEVRSLKELEIALEAGGMTRIMLDNFDLEDLEKGVDMIDGRFEVEASGGVNLETVRPIAETGVDFISVGALTHSAGSLDLSLKIVK